MTGTIHLAIRTGEGDSSSVERTEDSRLTKREKNATRRREG